MTVLVPIGTTEAPSSDFTAPLGVTLFLTNAVGGNLSPFVRADVQIKGSNDLYFNVGALTGAAPSQVLEGPGTYRVVRQASSTPFGVDSVQ